MKLLAELRALKGQIAKLQQNQKEPETAGVKITCTGMAITERDPVQVIGMIEMEIEELNNKLIEAQSKLIKFYENNY